MRVREAALIVALLAAGCAHSGAPRDWLPDAAESREQAHGGWVMLRLADGTHHGGELIAVNADRLVVLEDSSCVTFATAQVTNAYVTGYQSAAGMIAVWTAMGAVSTLSHGFVLIASLPAWLLVGSILTSVESFAPREHVSASTWQEARAYARFPQGMPEGLDPATLRPRVPVETPVKSHPRHWGH